MPPALDIADEVTAGVEAGLSAPVEALPRVAEPDRLIVQFVGQALAFLAR